MKGDKGCIHAAWHQRTADFSSSEFSGILLGFDDYVSQYNYRQIIDPMLTRGPDMVLEDVTELCVQSV